MHILHICDKTFEKNQLPKCAVCGKQFEEKSTKFVVKTFE